MKINKIILIFSIIFLFSCEGLLDIEQNTQISGGTAWSTESSAKANVAGMYVRMRSAFSQGFVYWGDYRNGLWAPGRINGDHEPFTNCYKSSLISSNEMTNWQDLYTTINQTNLVITHLPEVTFAKEDEKNEMLAGAYFVRAYCYYWIARIWGDAPLELQPYESIENNQYLFRSPVVEVFAQVESDITEARKLMPDNVISRSTASSASIELLAADYYLWKYKVRSGSSADLDAAETAITNFFGMSGYELESNFEKVFTDDNSKEIVFKWPYIQFEYEGGYPYDYLFNKSNIPDELEENPIPIYAARQQWVNISEEYADFLYAGQQPDIRAAVSYGKHKDFQYGWVNKFKGSMIESERVLDTDINAYRYADAILFDAEIKLAKNDLKGAQAALNKISKRAYGIEIYGTLTSADDVKRAIVTERKKEFVAEGRLWWDFIRLGVVFEECSWLQGRENAKNILLWPVHNSSLNSNPNITQTDGY